MDHVGHRADHPTTLLQLAAALNDCAIAAAEASDPAHVAQRLWAVSAQTAVFRRVALAVLAATTARAPGIALLTDPSAFDMETIAEVRDLLVALSPLLDQNDREAIGPAIDASVLDDDSKSWLLQVPRWVA